jgi:hypothetical protein
VYRSGRTDENENLSRGSCWLLLFPGFFSVSLSWVSVGESFPFFFPTLYPEDSYSPWVLETLCPPLVPQEDSPLLLVTRCLILVIGSHPTHRPLLGKCSLVRHLPVNPLTVPSVPLAGPDGSGSKHMGARVGKS